MEYTGAEIIIKTLIDEGVDTLFGYPGGAVIDIYNALYNYRDQIRHIRPSHEQGGAHAADGYSRSTGKTGVVLATSGPGATNLVTGIATAYMDSIPMVCITGNAASHLIGKDAFQEIDIFGATMSVTKHNFMITDIADLQDTIRRAFKIANSGRKGPVLIDVPKDFTQLKYPYEKKESLPIDGKHKIVQSDLEKFAEIINQAERPIIYAGGGINSSDSSQELRALMDKAMIPAVNTIMAIGVLGPLDQLNLGMVGMHGKNSSNYSIEHSDLVIALGTRFSDRVALNTKHFAPDAKIIQVDIDQSEIDKNVVVDFEIVGDLKEILAEILSLIEEKDRKDWLAQIEEFRKEDYQPPNGSDSIEPYKIIRHVAEYFGEDLIFVTDVGQHQMWTAQYCARTKPRTFLTSGGLGTMGFGFGASIGAKAGNPDKPVVLISGDGSFTMNMNELKTAVDHQINTITIILNNHALGMVRQWQNLLYDQRYSETDIDHSFDYVKLAEAFGAKGYSCATITEFKAAFADATTQNKPIIIEAIIDKDELVLPMIPAGGTVEDIIME
ncbi:MAG: biosynthetic-type acetolactate synthase large subunit [Clostridiaceae bacterium]|jgi:acetolactate synthase-1/2/3 large subunit|nr:biosynthetic-type acetolactate synthase large subunit [Bacillota bacterium]NLN51515.1 biosynthetic-type acetolactate synthase large subunit [Clostridiaceae bacterium]